MEVCPTSAKVQLNNGILSRRYERLDESIQRFERALVNFLSFFFFFTNEPFYYFIILK